MRRILLQLGIIVLASAIVVMLPVDVPCTIDTPGIVLSQKELTIIRNTDGSLVTILHDNLRNVVEQYTVSDVENGDRFSFTMNSALLNGTRIAAGDTIGRIVSNETEYRLTELKGLLETERATLALYRSGEKEPLVREAELQLHYTREQAEQKARDIARLRNLAEKHMTPEADMEREETLLRLYDIQAHMNEARIASLKTGMKQEVIDQTQRKIEAIKGEIAVLEKRVADATLISPITGYVVCSTASDTLAVVYGSDDYVVMLPVKWENRGVIAANNRVDLKVAGLVSTPSGTIEHVDDTSVIINGCNVLRAAAHIDSGYMDLNHGLYAQCSIRCQPQKLNRYIRRYLGI